MSVSMYRLSIPVFIRGLNAVAALIDKAESHAAEKNIPLETLFDARLAPDMLPFAGQIQSMSDTAKGLVARLTDIPAPSFPDDEKTFAELRLRIGKTIDFLESVGRDAIDGSETKAITRSFGGKEKTFSGEDYLLTFALPNFYFHVTTAYDILRNQGVALKKIDYLGSYDAI